MLLALADEDDGSVIDEFDREDLSPITSRPGPRARQLRSGAEDTFWVGYGAGAEPQSFVKYASRGFAVVRSVTASELAEHEQAGLAVVTSAPSGHSLRHSLWIEAAGSKRRIAPELRAVGALRFSPSGKSLALLGTEDDVPFLEYPALRLGVVHLEKGTLEWRTKPVAITRLGGRAEAELKWLSEDEVVCRTTNAARINVHGKPYNEPGQVLAFVAGQAGSVIAHSSPRCSLELVFCDGSGHPTHRWAPNQTLDTWMSAIPHAEARWSLGHEEIVGQAWGVPTSGPVVLSMHGGPHGFAGPVWSLTHAYRWLLAERGAYVVAPNPTGSGGINPRHLHEGRGRWGHEDVSQLLGLLDLLAQGHHHSPVGRRLLACGYSYGGYLAAKLAMASPHLARAVIGAPIIDVERFQRESDIGATFVGWHFGGPNAANLASSGVRVSGRPVAELLVLQGLADRRCPPQAAQQFVEELREHGAAPELIEYEGADHGLPAGRWDDVLDYHSRVVEWLLS